MDSKVTVGELKGLVARFVKERDWGKFHNPKDLAIALSIEAAELNELFLWDDVGKGRIDDKMSARVKEELADLMIYCLSFANAQGWDLSDVVQAKVRMNEAKYPADKYRGKARI